ncbi:MAG: hypothetical protein JXB13_16030 [Phycisphaerae bacterium]|nr:hypothetical protein [Phycisphaerae bacterium]
MNIRTRTFTMAVVIALSAGLAQGALFKDTFGNNIVTNSDTVTGFWEVRGTGGGFSVIETGGTLEMTTTSDNANNSESLHLGSVNAQSDFYFFNEPRTFSADVISHGGTASPIDHELRFIVYSEGGVYAFQANDWLTILIQEKNNVYVQEKINNAASTITTFSYSSAVTHFDLTLSSSGWSLDLTDDNSNVSTYSGSHNLTASDWNHATGAYAAFLAVKDDGSGGRTIIEIDNFVVVGPDKGTVITIR